MKTLEQLRTEMIEFDTNFAHLNPVDKLTAKNILRDLIKKAENTERIENIPDIPFLEARLHESEIRMFQRGLRRYFPLKAKNTHDSAYLFEAFEILYARKAADKGEIGMAMFWHGLESYVEFYKGRMWVRTVYKVDWDGRHPILLHH